MQPFPKIDLTTQAQGTLPTEFKSANFTAAANKEYNITGSSTIDCTLPTTAAAGDKITVSTSGTARMKIKQNAGQTISFNSSSTTSGTSGYLLSTTDKAILVLLCTTANSAFMVLGNNGLFSVV